MGTFEEIGMMPELIRAVEDMGWVLPTPVQAEAMPLILGGGDVMAVRVHPGVAATGAATRATTAANPVHLVCHAGGRDWQRQDGSELPESPAVAADAACVLGALHAAALLPARPRTWHTGPHAARS
jgi:hypothetical protein